jgi:sugar lactone lactonase YvrE
MIRKWSGTMRYFNIILSTSLLLVLCALSAAPALAVTDYFEPLHIALGPDGNIYALAEGNESTNNHIFVFAPDGRPVKTIDGHADEIAFDAAGNLYMLNRSFDNNDASIRITKTDKYGNATSLWSYRNNGMNLPVGSFAVSPDGRLYVSEFNDSRIIRLNENGTEQVVYLENNMNLTIGPMAVDANGTIYAVSTSNSFKIIAPDGTAKTVGRLGSSDGGFFSITGISLGKDGYLYVTESGNRRVQKLTTDGTFVAKWSGAGTYAFLYPFSATADASGKVYVVDPENERIVWFTPEYTFGENKTENLKGQDITWGNIYQGRNSTTRLQEQNENPAVTSTPGFSPVMSLTGIFLTGVVLYLGRAGKK